MHSDPIMECLDFKKYVAIISYELCQIRFYRTCRLGFLGYRKILTKHMNASSTSFWISLWAIVFLTLYILFRRNLIVNTHVLYAIPVGFVSLCAILAFYRALQTGPASVVIPLTNLYVVLPVLYGLFVLKESLTTVRTIGIVLAVVASILLSL
jgi:transporter family protein